MILINFVYLIELDLDLKLRLKPQNNLVVFLFNKPATPLRSGQTKPDLITLIESMHSEALT